jgi:5-methylcytosine-specific restriction endonuclease McrBC regulatory subunit McrC
MKGLSKVLINQHFLPVLKGRIKKNRSIRQPADSGGLFCDEA